jgi:hypothetical protein
MFLRSTAIPRMMIAFRIVQLYRHVNNLKACLYSINNVIDLSKEIPCVNHLIKEYFFLL